MPMTLWIPVILQMEVFNSSAVKNVGRLNCEFLRHEQLGKVSGHLPSTCAVFDSTSTFLAHEIG